MQRTMGGAATPPPQATLASAFLCACAALQLSGCGDDAERGDLAVLLQAEDTITEGLDPGTGDENVVDGWTVRFDKYLVAIGNVKLGRDVDHIEVIDTTKRVYDLVQIPQSDWQLGVLGDLEAKRYDFFGYETVDADAAERHESVDAADFDEMVAHEASYLIEGTLTRDAESVTFRFLVPNATQFGPCTVDGVPGVALTAGTAVSVGLTIHGDHFLFNSFGSHDVERRAQWIADADVDGSGHVDEEELATITGAALADLLPSAQYALGGWTAFPIDNAYDFLRAQLHTQGHYQGEGECVWTIDGVSGGDDHDDHDH